MRKSMGWIGVMVPAAAMVAMTAAPASAGNGDGAPLTVRKVPVGPVPPGTQFVVTVACEGRSSGQPIIFTGGPEAASQQLVFDAQGNPVGTDTVTFVSSGECLVTETQTGGAASVSYQCEGSVPPPSIEPESSGGGRFSPRLAGPVQLLPCQTSGPQSEPIGVNIASSQQEATVTVTNTFVDPGSTAAAVPVEAVPLFTG
jgi:hypothetical protein